MQFTADNNENHEQKIQKNDQFDSQVQSDLQANRKISTLVDEYNKLLNVSSQYTINENQLIQTFRSGRISYQSQVFQGDIEITIEEMTLNYQAIKLTAKYGHFSIGFNVINIDLQCPVKKLGESSKGSYGQVFKIRTNQKTIALKCIKIVQNRFETLLRGAIKEYFFLAIASTLRAGPLIVKIFGFDIAIFRDCICFSMEYCQMGPSNINWNELKTKLQVLHSLGIIHNDIKPENLAFSTTFNEFIFIDFGLSRMVKQVVGQKSATFFTGSMHFCSFQMLQLFLNDAHGMVDLYFNDAISLDKTIRKTNQQLSQNKRAFQDQQSIYPIQQSRMPNCKQFIDYSLLLRIKFTFFELSCNTICWTNVLSQYAQFIHINENKLNQFIMVLPQTLQLIHYYKVYLNAHASFDEPDIFVQRPMLVRRKINQDQISQLFLQRFKILQNINASQDLNLEQPSLKKQIEGVLFNRQSASKCRIGLYKVILAKFIRINSYHQSYMAKIQACKIFNNAHMSLNEGLNDRQLYKKTVSHLFMVALDNLGQQSFQILRNLIETIVILEIISQELFRMAFKKVLYSNTDQTQKMKVIFQFLTSLQFVREKYRKQYHYQELIIDFFQELKNIVVEKMKNIANKDEEIFFTILRYIIGTKIAGKECKFDNDISIYKILKPQNIIIRNKKLNQIIGNYIVYGMIRNELERYNSCKNKSIQQMLILLGKQQKQNKFTYLHLAIFHALQIINQTTENSFIYQLFYQQLQHFEELKFFNIYLFYQIKTIKKSFSTQIIKKKYEIHQSHQIVNDYLATNSFEADFDQIFTMMDYLVKNNKNYHLYIDYLLIKPPAIHFNQRCVKYMTALIENNPKNITNLSRNSSQIHEEHYTSLKYQIYVISHIFQYMAEFIKVQSWTEILREFMIQCQKTIRSITCIQCKTHALLYVNQLYANYIHIQGKVEESFLLVFQNMIFHLQHFQIFHNAFEFMIPLIRRWSKFIFLFKKYNLQRFIYEYIKQTKNHHYCLVDIRQFNIFVVLYYYVVKSLPNDEIIDFIRQIVYKLGVVKTIHAIDHFYFSLFFIIQQTRRLKTIQNFKNYHDILINQFLSFKNVKEIPYIGIYLYALLNVRLRSGNEQKMMKIICLSIKNIDKYSKRLILNNYFYYFALYQPLNIRKNVYICNQHLKKSNQQFTFKFIFEIKFNVRADKRKGKEKIKLLKYFLKRYYFNIGNTD